MAEHKTYLTVAREKRQPENDGYIAVISRGHPQRGDGHCEVLSVTIVPNMKAAKSWHRRELVEKAWEARQ